MSKGLKLFLSILGVLTVLYGLYYGYSSKDWTNIAGSLAVGLGLLSVNFSKEKSNETE